MVWQAKELFSRCGEDGESGVGEGGFKNGIKLIDKIFGIYTHTQNKIKWDPQKLEFRN